jgi:hypothetical protein
MLGITNSELSPSSATRAVSPPLHHISDGAIPTVPLITGHVGIGGVAQAFEELGSPERHSKILVHPER